MDNSAMIALRKAQKAFALAGEHPATAEQKEAYRLGRALLDKMASEASETVAGIKPLPSPFKSDSRPFWSFGEKIKRIPWDEFFKVEKNRYVTYRIIPHSGVSNNNKRLWRAIHRMYEMYESAGSRLERDGFRFRYREKDLFWFDIIFRQQAGQRRVEFYVSTSEYQALKLKRKLEGKIEATFEEVEPEALHVPDQNTIIQEVRYTRHDVFSINTNTQEAKTPIASILAAVDELQHDGDLARLSVCNEAVNRRLWVKNASYAYEKINAGKVPQRSNVSGRRVLTAAGALLGAAVNEVNSLLTDTLQAISHAFIKSDKAIHEKKIVKKPFSLEDEINAKRLTAASADKINHPVFKSRIRIAAHSTDKLTRETISDTLATAFADLSDNNELQACPVRIGSRKYEIIQELNTLSLSVRSLSDGNANLVSTEEMAKIALQLPTADLQRKYDDALSTKRRIETDVPAALRGESGIYLGDSEIKGVKVPVYFPANNPDDFYRGYVFIGGMGAGKDTTIKNWIIDCASRGISAVIPEVIVEDGERGMADGLRDSLPPEQIIDIDMSDPDYIVPLDLTEVIGKLGRDGASRFADEVIDFFGDMEGMARSKRYLKAAAKAAGGSLYNIKRIIEDDSYRMDVIERLQADGNIRLVAELAQWGTNAELGSKADPIINRLDDFFGNDKLYDVFCQPASPGVDFAKWMQEGKIIIVRIPARRLGQLAAKTLVHWLTLKVFMTRMLMDKQDQKNGCFMVFNEPEQYATEGLTRLMGRIGTEGRKEYMGSLYAFHHWNKLPQSLQENLQGGGVQQFLFYNDHIKTFESSRHRLEPTLTVEEASRIPKHHAIISARIGSGLQAAFICHMKPPIPAMYDNSKLTKEHTKRYGRNWRDLQNIG